VTILAESIRLTPGQYLHMLCDLWAEVLLFHPVIAHPGRSVDWHRTFSDSLLAIASADSASACVRVLNEVLLAPLNDPLSLAAIPPRSSSLTSRSEDDRHATIECLRVPGAGDAALVRLPPWAFARETFLSDVCRAVQSVPSGKLLLVDLRWESPFQRTVPTTFLGAWAGSTAALQPVTRVYRGYHELEHSYVYSQRWETERPLRPLPIHVEAPTVFLLDNASVLHFKDPLAGLGDAANVNVVWQRTGAFSMPERRCLRYPGGIRVHLGLSIPAFAPDLVVDREMSDGDLAGLHLASRKRALSTGLAGRMICPDVPLLDPVPSRTDRLTGLAKAAVVLDHFYPHSDLARLRRGELLSRWIAPMEAAASWKEYCIVLEEMLASLRDSHAAVMHSSLVEDATERLPIESLVQDAKSLIVRAPAGTPLSIGDEVVEVDGRPFSEIVEEWRRRISASSEQAFVRDLNRRLWLRPKGRVVELTYRRGSVVRRTAVGAEPWMPAPPPENGAAAAALALPGCGHAVRMTDGRLACVMPFDLPDVRALDLALDMVADSAGLVLDVRGYPRAHFQHALVRRLCNHPVRSPRYEIPVAGGSLPVRRRWKTIRYVVRPEDEAPRPRGYDKPVVALISEQTQSSAEDLCMYLRIAGRVTFVGRPTAGCHGNAAFVLLPGGAQVSFTGMRVRWPDGSRFQGIGIEPDVPVEASEDILQKGLEVLRRLTASS